MNHKLLKDWTTAAGLRAAIIEVSSGAYIGPEAEPAFHCEVLRTATITAARWRSMTRPWPATSTSRASSTCASREPLLGGSAPACALSVAAGSSSTTRCVTPSAGATASTSADFIRTASPNCALRLSCRGSTELSSAGWSGGAAVFQISWAFRYGGIRWPPPPEKLLCAPAPWAGAPVRSCSAGRRPMRSACCCAAVKRSAGSTYTETSSSRYSVKLGT